MSIEDELKIVRVMDLVLIPKYLLDQVKDVYWTPEELYGIWPAMEGNVTNLLFAIVDREHQVKGMIWATVSLIGAFLFVNVVSLDRAWQGRGVVQSLIMPYLKNLKIKMGLKKMLATSSRPRAMERLGWKTAKHLMEG